MVLFYQRMIFLTFIHYFIHVERILIVSFQQKNKSYISNRSQQKEIITKNNKIQKVCIKGANPTFSLICNKYQTSQKAISIYLSGNKDHKELHGKQWEELNPYN